MKGWGLAKRHVAFDIGNGDTVKFWEDKWFGDTDLRSAFPPFYNIAANKEIMVSSICQVNDLNLEDIFKTGRLVLWVVFLSFCMLRKSTLTEQIKCTGWGRRQGVLSQVFLLSVEKQE